MIEARTYSTGGQRTKVLRGDIDNAQGEAGDDACGELHGE
jgi:hypothetical protein